MSKEVGITTFCISCKKHFVAPESTFFQGSNKYCDECAKNKGVIACGKCGITIGFGVHPGENILLLCDMCYYAKP